MISVLIPTYNRPQFIRGAVDAILSQDYSDFEIIVKDGGESIEHLLPTDPRIRYIHNKDRGITDAMNQAMKAAKGDIFVWANDDDRITPGTFRYVVENIGDAKWAYGYIWMTNGVDGIKWGKPWDYEALKQNNIVPQPSVYWTREAYEEVGEMCEEQDLTSDYEYWLRLGSKFEPRFFDRIMANYTIHKDQITQKIMGEQLRQANETKKKYGYSNGA